MCFFSKKIKLCGKDRFGNSYYILNGKREIRYRSDKDATKISTEWFLWLHYATDKLPNQNILSNKEYRVRIPNLTGTAGVSMVTQQMLDENRSVAYDPWNPNGD